MIRPYAIDIIMLEDKPLYQGSFEAQASKERMIVKSVDNAEDLIDLIREKPRKYKFIVLDARAFFTEGEQQGTEDEANLIYVFRELKNIQVENGVTLHYAINTGFADIKLRHEKRVDCPIFEKGNEAELFDYIWEVQNKTEEAFVKSNFPEIIPLYDIHFTDKVKEKVLSLYNNNGFNNSSLKSRLENLSSLRMINEQIMDILYEEIHGKTWRDITESIGGRSKAIALALGSLGTISDYLRDVCVGIYHMSSKYGEHSEEDVKEDSGFPTNRMIDGYAKGLLELFIASNKLLNL